MAGTSIPIRGYTDTIKTNGCYYYVHDLELRRLINDDTLDDDSNSFIPTSRLIKAVLDALGISINERFDSDEQALTDGLALKLDLQTFLDFINNSLAAVALSNDYNDLINKPDIGGIASVEGTALVFNSSSVR